MVANTTWQTHANGDALVVDNTLGAIPVVDCFARDRRIPEAESGESPASGRPRCEFSWRRLRLVEPGDGFLTAGFERECASIVWPLPASALYAV